MTAELARTPMQASILRFFIVLVSFECAASSCHWGHCLTTTPWPVIPKDNVDEGAIVAGVAGTAVALGGIGAGIAAVALQRRKVDHQETDATGLDFAKHHPGDPLPAPAPLPPVSMAPTPSAVFVAPALSFERHPAVTTTTVPAYVQQVERALPRMRANAQVPSIATSGPFSGQLSRGYAVVTSTAPLSASTPMLHQSSGSSSVSWMTTIVSFFMIAAILSAVTFCLCLGMKRRLKKSTLARTTRSASVDVQEEAPEARVVSHTREPDLLPVESVEEASSTGSSFPIFPNVLLPMKTPSVVNRPAIVSRPTSQPLPYVYNSVADVMSKYTPQQSLASQPAVHQTPAPTLAPTAVSMPWMQYSTSPGQQPPSINAQQPPSNQGPFTSTFPGQQSTPINAQQPPPNQGTLTSLPRQSLTLPAPVPQQSSPTPALGGTIAYAPSLAGTARAPQPTVSEAYQREVSPVRPVGTAVVNPVGSFKAPVTTDTGVVRELIAASPTELISGLSPQKKLAEVRGLPVFVEAGIDIGVAKAAVMPSSNMPTGSIPMVLEAGLTPGTVPLQRFPSAAISNQARLNALMPTHP